MSQNGCGILSCSCRFEGNATDFGSFKVTFTIDWFNLSSETRVGTFKVYNSLLIPLTGLWR